MSAKGPVLIMAGCAVNALPWCILLLHQLHILTQLSALQRAPYTNRLLRWAGPNRAHMASLLWIVYIMTLAFFSMLQLRNIPGYNVLLLHIHSSKT